MRKKKKTLLLTAFPGGRELMITLWWLLLPLSRIGLIKSRKW